VAGDFLGVDRLGSLPAAAGPGELDRLGLVVRVPEEWDAFRQAGSIAETRRRAGTVRPGDVSDIMFTSGTTGRSKGAMTSHERSLGVARAWAECAGLGPGDRYLVVNPFFRTFGFKAGILACLVSGAALVPGSVRRGRGDAAGRGRADHRAARGAHGLPDDPGPSGAGRPRPVSLRLAVTGAADVPVALVERMRRELSFSTVLTAYGLTEAVVATMCRPPNAPTSWAWSAGWCRGRSWNP
jgi:acyl-CoA synthetase (AMP-forming)/AMP-acid ligase II